MAEDQREMDASERFERYLDAILAGGRPSPHHVSDADEAEMARLAAEHGDDGTNDLLVSDVIRTNEFQVWFVGEHLVDVPLVHAD